VADAGDVGDAGVDMTACGDVEAEARLTVRGERSGPDALIAVYPGRSRRCTHGT
jgi:hypothetical protein